MTYRSASLYRLCSGLAVSTVIIVMHALGACSSGIDASRASETALAGASKSTSSEALLNGTITYKRPMAIPRDAMVEVSLLDLTDATSPVVVAEQRFRAARQAPMSFDLCPTLLRTSPAGMCTACGRVSWWMALCGSSMSSRRWFSPAVIPVWRRYSSGRQLKVEADADPSAGLPGSSRILERNRLP